jgi:hypothetical protein
MRCQSFHYQTSNKKKHSQGKHRVCPEGMVCRAPPWADGRHDFRYVPNLLANFIPSEVEEKAFATTFSELRWLCFIKVIFHTIKFRLHRAGIWLPISPNDLVSTATEARFVDTIPFPIIDTYHQHKSTEKKANARQNEKAADQYGKFASHLALFQCASSQFAPRPVSTTMGTLRPGSAFFIRSCTTSSTRAFSGR